jgi:hypothetical protein
LLGKEVGAVQALVGLLDACELELLMLAEVGGVLPEHEAGAFEILRELLVAGAAGFVPDLAADLIHRIGRGLDDVKRVKANHGVGAALGDGPRDPLGVIARHQLDLLAALFTEVK